ncbi:MAG: hypothetical protein BM556_02055 [Bacteriovorax sp. MedPE-SWde]|nr:MAG: hypothetical protein BM556_02055 [Bacteriovorax sp. MedPE-SWde]
MNKAKLKLVEIISKGPNFSIKRLEDPKSGKTYIEKTQLHKKADLINEINILKKTNYALDLVSYNTKEFPNHILINDYEGEQLSKGNYSTLSSIEKAKIFLLISKSVKDLHECGIIHKNLNSYNILLSNNFENAKVINFRLAQHVSSQRVPFTPLKQLQSDINYISPELTGRINRNVDTRSDLYSLGITFFEILTGELPFKADNEVDTLFMHLTQDIVFDETIDIPVALTNIINKLTEKRPEDRYQNINQCINDLSLFINSNDTTQKKTLNNTSYHSEVFQVPETIYGRDDQIKKMFNIYSELSNSKESIFLTGPSGIGKTVLVQELFKPLTRDNGHFVSGKFDQIKKDDMSGALISALNDFFKNLLSEPDNILQEWKHALKKRLGINAKVITDIIPEIEAIIGKPNQPASLGPSESQTRFEIMFVDLFKLIGEFDDRPLIVFIDDLQWASARSIDLLNKILSDRTIKNIQFIGAYRDNEVDSSHPLQLLINENNTVNSTLLNLPAFNISTTKKLVSDTLGETQAQGSFAKLIQTKTAGNPFHVKQFLLHLYRKKLINYDKEAQQFKYNLEDIEAQSYTENVVDLLITHMRSLPAEVQDFISYAAALGNKFKLEHLSYLTKLGHGEIFDILEVCISENYLFLEDFETSTYKFAHDRIQEASYNLLSDSEKERLHYKIGNFFKELKAQADLACTLITGHLNKAIGLLKDDEFLPLIKLNIESSLAAKNSTAFKESLNYIDIANTLSKKTSLISEDLKFTINEEMSNLLYLNGRYDECESFTLKALKNFTSGINATKLYNQLIIQYTAQGRYEDSISIGRKALKILNIELPETELEKSVQEELNIVHNLVKGISIPDLAKMEEMKDEEKRMAMALLINLDSPCYLSNVELYCIVVAKMVQLSINYGPVPESAKGYASYGIVLCAYNEFKLGYYFNQLGIDIADRYQHLGQVCRANHTMANHVQFWTKHIEEGDECNDKGFIAGHDAGEYLWAGFIKLFKPNNQFWRGRNLQELMRDIDTGLHYCKEHPNQIGVDTLTGLKLISSSLTINESSNELTEKTYIENCKSQNSLMSLSMFLSVRIFTHIINQRYDLAKKHIDESISLLPYSFSVVTNAYDYFSKAFLLARIAERSSEQETDYKENLKHMEIWSDSCPENFKHLYLIIIGVNESTRGNTLEATNIFEEAADLATQSNFPHIQGLAYELIADAWAQLDKRDISKLYYLKAIASFEKWGATAKVKSIREVHNLDTQTNSSVEDQEEITSNIDTSVLLKAYNVMGKDLNKAQLLKTMLTIMVENLGATSGAIYLNSNTGLKLTESSNYKDGHIFQHLISYTFRKKKHICISQKNFNDLKFYEDLKHHKKSVLSFPLVNDGVIYLENSFHADAFSKSKVEILGLLSRQLNTGLEHLEAIEQAKEFNVKLEKEVSVQTAKLLEERDNAKEITKNLQDAQRKLVTSARDAGRAEVASNVLHNVGNAVMTLTGHVELLEARLLNEESEEIFKALLEKIKSYSSFEDFLKRDEVGKDFYGLLNDTSELITSQNTKNNKSIEKIRQKIELVIKLIKSERQSIASNSKVVENIDLENLIDEAAIISDIDSSCKLTKNLEVHDQLGIEYDKVKNIVINFFSNANKACEDNSKQAEIYVSAYTEDNFLFIEVEDNGKGMTEEVCSRVFNPGFSTKGVEGSGFGLHNSAVVTKSMDGEISAFSNGPGLGAKFILKIPLNL